MRNETGPIGRWRVFRSGRNHIAVAIRIVGKGKSEPYDVMRLPYTPSQDEVWALDRRVDFIR